MAILAGSAPQEISFSAYSGPIVPRVVCMMITQSVSFCAWAAARKNISSIGEMTLSLDASLITPALIPVPSIPSVSSVTIISVISC